MPDAKKLSTLIENDLQMQLPQHPRLSEDFVKIWGSSQLLIIGGSTTDVVFRGKSVSTILPQLLPLLNGRHTIEQIAAQISGYSEQAVRDAISLLYMRGLLEEGKFSSKYVTKEVVQAFKSQLKFYSRFVDQTRYSKSRYEVLERLLSSHVLLAAQGTVGYLAAVDLITSGVGALDVVTLDRSQPWENLCNQSPFTRVNLIDMPLDKVESLLNGQHLLMMVTAQPSPDEIRMMNGIAHRTNTPMMSATIHRNLVEIGPIFIPGKSPCYECAHIQGALDLDTKIELDGTTLFSDCPDWVSPEEKIGVSQASFLVVNYLTHLMSMMEMGTFRLAMDTLEWTFNQVANIVACPVCGTVEDYGFRSFPLGRDYQENLPTMYHLNARVKAYQMHPKGHQVHYRDEVLETLKHSQKVYRGTQTVALPPAAPGEQFKDSYAQSISTPASASASISDTPAKPRTAPVTFQDIATLLRTVGEVTTYERQNMVFQKRMTPSGGNLLSQTIYLVNFNLPECEPGIYHFRHEGFLEQIRKGDFRQAVDGAVVDSAALPGEPAAAIIQTAQFARVESKYGARAFGYTMIDAGAMLHSLQYVSQLLNMDVWQSLNFYDDELLNLLNVQSVEECPVYVLYFVQPGQAK